MADVVFTDNGPIVTAVRRWVLGQARVTIVTPETEEETRTKMLQEHRAGQRVVRVRRGRGWRSPDALRDARALQDAAAAFEVIPGVDEEDDTWRVWLDRRPLFGRRVVVLRMQGQASDTADLLLACGADPWIFPTIALHPPPDPGPLREALRDLASYDVVAFTSANGVDQVFVELDAMGRDARAFGECKVAAIGTATAKRLRDRGIAPDVVAKEFRGESLAVSIEEACGVLRDKRVLIPRAREAREVLPELLRAQGATVDVVVAYETLPPEPSSVVPLREALEAARVDAVLLTASSTVTNLCALLGEGHGALLRSACVASIGPITTARAKELGLEVQVEADPYTIPGLIEALERHFAGSG